MSVCARPGGFKCYAPDECDYCPGRAELLRDERAYDWGDAAEQAINDAADREAGWDR